MSDRHLTYEKLTEKLNRLHPKKAAGHDNITTRELKLISGDISLCLLSICKQSYLEGKFPTNWKICKLKPIYESEERIERGNYRPLTMLPILSKVFAAVICNQLGNQVNLTRQRNQRAHKKNTSTKSLRLNLSEVWKNAINHGQTVVTIFVDCSKAFGAIDHKF